MKPPRKRTLPSKKTVDLAQKVRDTVQHWVKKNPSIWVYDMTGACAIASYALWRVLKANSIRSKFVYSEYHCWVVVGSNIVDITATQFDASRPDVFVTRIGSRGYRAKAYNEDGFKRTKDWCRQSPWGYTKKVEELVKRLA